MKWFLTFGEKSAKKMINLLFVIGLVPIFFYSIVSIWVIARSFQFVGMVRSGIGYTSAVKDNTLLGLICGIGIFIVLVLLWKVICELLFLIFRSLEVYIRKNKTTDENEYL